MKNQLKELLILHFINDGVRTVLIVLLPFIAKDLSLSLTQVGFLGSSQPLIAAFLALPAGYIAGRFGGFQVMLGVLVIYSISILGIAFSMNIPLLFTMYLLAAFGFGIFHPVAFALVANTSSEKSVGKNMGNFMSVGDIGRLCLPPLSILIAAAIGWRLTLGVIGLIGILLFFVFRFTAKVRDVYSLIKNNEKPQSQKQFLKDIVILFNNKRASYIGLAAIFDSIASSPTYIFLPFLLLAKGLDPIQLSIAMGGCFTGGVVGKILLGRFMDKIGETKVLIFAEVIMAITLILTPQFNNFLILILLSFLLGTFTKGTSPVIQAMFSQLADKKHYHKVFAVSELFITVASVITITILGIIGDFAGLSMIYYICSVFAIFTIVPVVAFAKNKVIVLKNPISID